MATYYYAANYNHGFYDPSMIKALDGFIKCERSDQLQTPSGSPPSYYAVMAEKYRRPSYELEMKLNEMNDMIHYMKRSMIDTHIMIANVNYICLRLECKNDYLIEKLNLISLSDTINASSDRQEINSISDDSLSRMNHSLEMLIEEAQDSLNTRLSLHSQHHLRRIDSCPRFTKKYSPEVTESRRKSNADLIQDDSQLVRKSDQQKTRYLESESNLDTAMKQLMKTIEDTESASVTKCLVPAPKQQPVQPTQHTHHTIKPLPHTSIKLSKTPIKSIKDSITSSFINYALKTVGIHQIINPLHKSQHSKKTASNPLHVRMLFYASLLVLPTIDHSIFIYPSLSHLSRGRRLLIMWNQKSKQQCDMWVQYIHLLVYVMRCMNY